MLRPGRGGEGTSLPTSAYGTAPSPYGAGYGGYTGSQQQQQQQGYGSNGYNSNGSSYGGYSGGNNSSSAYGSYGGDVAPIYSAGYKDKPRRRGKQNAVVSALMRFKEPWTWPIAVAVLFFVLTIRYKVQQSSFLKQVKANSYKEVIQIVRNGNMEKDGLRRELKTMKESYRKALENSSNLAKEKRDLTKELEELKRKDPADKARIQTREDAWKNQVQLLQQATSRESRRAATEKYGPGPHFVEFTILLPHVPEDQAERKFTIQMAPLESMPHAVHLFLEQVSHGLWNNAWFYINGPHVLQAGPQADEKELAAAIAAGEDERALALRPFRELQLDTLAFPEYSEDYPHVTWTLGYTGRPGGPDFYINKVDNTAAHGPGGQFHHELEEFADSCFAKVVNGFDTMKAMINAPTVEEKSEYQYFLEEPIHIINAVLTDDPSKPKVESTPEKTKDEEAPETPKDEAAPEKQHEYPEKVDDEVKEEVNAQRSRASRRAHKKRFKPPAIEHQVEP